MNNLNWDNWESDLKKSVAEREQFFKGQSHKYFKREGTPGHYKYYYTEQEWKEAHSKSGNNEKNKQLRDKDLDKDIIKLVNLKDEKYSAESNWSRANSRLVLHKNELSNILDEIKYQQNRKKQLLIDQEKDLNKETDYDKQDEIARNYDEKLNQFKHYFIQLENNKHREENSIKKFKEEIIKLYNIKSKKEDELQKFFNEFKKKYSSISIKEVKKENNDTILSSDELNTLKTKIEERTDAAFKNNPRLDKDDLKEQIAELAIEQTIKDKKGYDKTRNVPFKTMKKLATPIFKELGIKHILYNK